MECVLCDIKSVLCRSVACAICETVSLVPDWQCYLMTKPQRPCIYMAATTVALCNVCYITCVVCRAFQWHVRHVESMCSTVVMSSSAKEDVKE